MCISLLYIEEVDWVLWIIGISYKLVGGYFKGCIDKVYWYVKCVFGIECVVNNVMK